jgi:hypothetical protein
MEIRFELFACEYQLKYIVFYPTIRFLAKKENSQLFHFYYRTGIHIVSLASHPLLYLYFLSSVLYYDIIRNVDVVLSRTTGMQLM